MSLCKRTESANVISPVKGAFKATESFGLFSCFSAEPELHEVKTKRDKEYRNIQVINFMKNYSWVNGLYLRIDMTN
ncbi:hypothetical protein BH20BAC1_BH20BAC1_03000 [soil metagenome]